MRQRFIDSTKSEIPVWTYWLAFLLFLALSTIAFAISGGDLCSASTEAAIDNHAADTCIDYWLNRYQTLFGAAVALVAAAIGYLAIALPENYRRAREEEAARAILAVPLAEICSYVEDCASALSEWGEDSDKPIALRAFPSRTLILLRDSIRASRGRHVDQLKELIATIQIFLSRYRKPFGRKYQIDQCQLDICDLLIKTERLFPYSRTTALKPSMNHAEALYAIARLSLQVRENTPLHIYLRSTSADGSSSGDVDSVDIELE